MILAGDLNSDPTGATGAKPDAYNVFTAAGLRDTWLLRNPKGSGNNCCLKQETITDPPPGPFDHRVDHILAKGRFKVLRTRIVGTDPANRTAGGPVAVRPRRRGDDAAAALARADALAADAAAAAAASRARSGRRRPRSPAPGSRSARAGRSRRTAIISADREQRQPGLRRHDDERARRAARRGRRP